ncbi:MAG: L,D-transpeptidase family protein [Desulfomonilaceae bacterium]
MVASKLRYFRVLQKLTPRCIPFFFAVVATACMYELATAQSVDLATPRDRIVISKSRQILELFKNGAPKKSYRVCLGLNPSGPKRIQGDRKTPEGDYFICYKSAESRFHRFLGISYPGAHDAQAAFEAGLICLDERDAIIDRIRKGEAPPWNTRLGGWVGIHGYPSAAYESIWALLLYPKPHNWTDGCIALWNFEIEELYGSVSLNTPVHIEP